VKAFYKNKKYRKILRVILKMGNYTSFTKIDGTEAVRALSFSLLSSQMKSNESNLVGYSRFKRATVYFLTDDPLPFHVSLDRIEEALL
jgi:hypothetical protein